MRLTGPWLIDGDRLLPLQPFLEQIRADLELSIAVLANELAVDEKDLVRLERGETALSSQEPALDRQVDFKAPGRPIKFHDRSSSVTGVR